MGFFDSIFNKKKKGVGAQMSTKPQQKENTNAYLVIFSADWCGPSKRFVSAIQAAGIHNYTKVDVDNNDELALKYGVRSIPTTILLNENGHEIKRWVGYDDEDPRQSKFVDFIKSAPFKILPYEVLNPKINGLEKDTHYEDAVALLTEIIGTEEKPAKIENKKLKDGSTYTGEAILCKDGFYLPYGYGKKVISKQIEMTGHWVNGNANGMCYVNMHHSMVTGHFKDSRPEGWCLSVEGGRGFVFGVFKYDDCVVPLGEIVLWMMRGIDMGLKTSYKKGFILVGEIRNNKACGFHFMNNGDLYVGTDDQQLNKTGYFFKFTLDGYIQIGRFVQGRLIEKMSPKDVIKANGMDATLLKTPIDTSRKYF